MLFIRLTRIFPCQFFFAIGQIPIVYAALQLFYIESGHNACSCRIFRKKHRSHCLLLLIFMLKLLTFATEMFIIRNVRQTSKRI